MCLATAYFLIFPPLETGDPLIDMINDGGSLGVYRKYQKLIKEYWNPNLSEVSNRANIINIYYELYGEKPYFPMLPNGELDIEALKLKREKEKKERHEAQLKYEEEMEERETARKAYKESFWGEFDKLLS